jgi:hypothetical protein
MASATFAANISTAMTLADLAVHSAFTSAVGAKDHATNASGPRTRLDRPPRKARRPRSSIIASQNLAGNADVLSPGFLGEINCFGKWGITANAGQLDQHRQIHAGDDLDVGFIHD